MGINWELQTEPMPSPPFVRGCVCACVRDSDTQEQWVRQQYSKAVWTLDRRHLTHRSACAGTLSLRVRSNHVAGPLLRDCISLNLCCSRERQEAVLGTRPRFLISWSAHKTEHKLQQLTWMQLNQPAHCSTQTVYFKLRLCFGKNIT